MPERRVAEVPGAQLVEEPVRAEEAQAPVPLAETLAPPPPTAASPTGAQVVGLAFMQDVLRTEKDASGDSTLFDRVKRKYHQYGAALALHSLLQ